MTISTEHDTFIYFCPESLPTTLPQSRRIKVLFTRLQMMKVINGRRKHSITIKTLAAFIRYCLNFAFGVIYVSLASKSVLISLIPSGLHYCLNPSGRIKSDISLRVLSSSVTTTGCLSPTSTDIESPAGKTLREVGEPTIILVLPSLLILILVVTLHLFPQFIALCDDTL